jgi:hypothetical protein
MESESIKKLKEVAIKGASAEDVKNSPSWKAISERFGLLANAHRKILEKMEINDAASRRICS